VTTGDREHRTARLAQAAAARARRAITNLRNTGELITFVSVARTAGVSTSFLYQHPELRHEVGEHRTHTSGHAHVLTASSATVESLRTKLAVAVQRNRELAEEVAVLRTENEVLRSHVLELNHRRTSTSRTG